MESRPLTSHPPLRPDERERFEERVAIREYDGGTPLAEAERLALEEVIAARGRQDPEERIRRALATGAPPGVGIFAQPIPGSPDCSFGVHRPT